MFKVNNERHQNDGILFVIIYGLVGFHFRFSSFPPNFPFNTYGDLIQSIHLNHGIPVRSGAIEKLLFLSHQSFSRKISYPNFSLERNFPKRLNLLEFLGILRFFQRVLKGKLKRIWSFQYDITHMIQIHNVMSFFLIGIHSMLD